MGTFLHSCFPEVKDIGTHLFGYRKGESQQHQLKHEILGFSTAGDRNGILKPAKAKETDI